MKKQLNRKYLNKPKELQPRTIEEVKFKEEEIIRRRILISKQKRFNSIIYHTNKEILDDHVLVLDLQSMFEELKQSRFKYLFFKRIWIKIKRILFYEIF